MPILLLRNGKEKQERMPKAKPFWEAFFKVFGVTRKRIASFEEPVKKLGSKTGFIDLYNKSFPDYPRLSATMN